MTCVSHITNIGDFVQAIAAKQYYPKTDKYIDRELLSRYEGENVDMIMNGWYMHEPTHWPPSNKINPLYVSLHINPRASKGMTSKEGIEHFKKNEPIGCRDLATVELLKEKGINAYFTSCLTLTLGRTYKRENVDDKIYMVDTLYHFLSIKEMITTPRKAASRFLKGRFFEFLTKKKVLNENFEYELLSKVEYLKQNMPAKSEDECFKIADEYLKKLSKAKLVITSRIHCALPCLAMGTPVIFLNGGFGGNGKRFDSRFGGIIDLFNRIDIDNKGKVSKNFSLNGKISSKNFPKNKSEHLKFAEKLNNTCEKFIKSQTA